MTASPLLTDLLAPFPGRCGRTIEIAVVCMIVVVVSMTFQIPSPAISAYVIFFAAKENSGLNIVSCLVFIIVVSVIVGLLFVLAPLALNYPTYRIVLIAAVSYAAFFLESASKLAPIAGVYGIVTGYALDLLQESFVGELTTRGLLYAWLFVAMPMSVFAVYSMVFGRHPEVLLRQRLTARLGLAATALRSGERGSIAAAVAGGNMVFMVELAMTKLFRRQPSDTLLRLGAIVTLSYALLIAVMAQLDEGGAVPAGLPNALDALAAKVGQLPRTGALGALQQAVRTDGDLVSAIRAAMAAMDCIIDGGPLPDLGTPPKKPKTGFFVPDAFSNPDHTRFAVKGALAVVVCYLTFNLLDWPGIHTCMITCFVVALKTVGETLQKALLRLGGTLFGAALGLAAIVFVLPQTTSITALVLTIGLVTLPAAWIATGKPSVGYIGFQVSLALYFCLLQGTEPKFDLTIIRDRVIGILFGELVVYLIFTRVFPVSLLGALRQDLVHLLARCRAVLKMLSEGRPEVLAAKDMAEVQAMLGALEEKAAVFALENRRTTRARLYYQASRLSVKALRDLVHDLARLAAYPAFGGSEQDRALLGRLNSDCGGALESLEASLSGAASVELEEDAAAWDGANAMRHTEAAWTGRLAAYASLHRHIESVSAVLGRYRRLLKREAQAYG